MPKIFLLCFCCTILGQLAAFATSGVDSLSAYHLVICKSAHTLILYRDSLAVSTFPCATGKVPGDKQTENDNRTPEGNFCITSVEDASGWWHDFKGDGKGPVKGAYGPWFFRLYTGADSTLSGKAWTGIGIHGTNDPASIGRDASEGCIRLDNKDLLELKKYLRPGQPVRIEA